MPKANQRLHMLRKLDNGFPIWWGVRTSVVLLDSSNIICRKHISQEQAGELCETSGTLSGILSEVHVPRDMRSPLTDKHGHFQVLVSLCVEITGKVPPVTPER